MRRALLVTATAAAIVAAHAPARAQEARAAADEAASPPGAHDGDGDHAPRVVELSRLWIDPPEADAALLVYPYAGHAGVELRGWDDGRYVFRPGLDVAAGGYLSPPRLLPEGSRDFGLHVSDELAYGPMFGANVDEADLLARYPTTIAPQLAGGRRQLFNDARASASGPVIDDRIVWYAEALDLRTATTYLGSYRPEIDSRPRYTLNVAWQPTPYTRVTIGGRYDAIATDNYGLSAWTFDSAARTRRIDQTTLVASVRHQISPRTEIAATYDLIADREDYKPANGTAVPGHYNLDTYQTWGNYPTTVRARAITHRLDAHASTFLDGLILPDDAHTITLGVQGELTTREDDESLNGGLAFVDATSTPPGGTPPPTIDPNDRNTWTLFSSDRGDELHAKIAQSAIAAYLKDTIAIGSSFRVTPGVRYEHFEGAFQGGPTVWRTDTIAPRVGLVWDLDLFTTIFGDVGRHYQALDPSFLERAAAGAAYSPLQYWDWSGPPQLPSDPALADPRWGTNGGRSPTQQFPAVVGASALGAVKHPYVDRLAIGVVRRFEAIRLRAKLRYEYRHFGDMVALYDAAGQYAPQTYAIAGSTAPRDTVGYYALSAPGTQRYVIANVPDARHELHTVALAIHQDVTDWLATRGSLTWTFDRGDLDTTGGLSTEWRTPSGRVNAYGNMPGFDTWVARVGATVDLPLAIRAWGDYTFRSGQYYSRVFRISPPNEPRIFVYDAAGRGGYQLPARHVVDVGGSRDVASFAGGRLSAWLQVYNLLNAATVVSVSEKTTYFNSVKALEMPRELHVGLRYDL